MESHPGQIKELRTNPVGERSPEGPRKGHEHARRAEDEASPQQRLFLTVRADLLQIEGEEGKKEVEREVDPELGDADKDKIFEGALGARAVCHGILSAVGRPVPPVLHNTSQGVWSNGSLRRTNRCVDPIPKQIGLAVSG